MKTLKTVLFIALASFIVKCSDTPPTPEDFKAIPSPVVEIQLGLRPNHRFYDIVKTIPTVCSKLSSFMTDYYQTLETKLGRVKTGPIQDVASLKTYAQKWFDKLSDPSTSDMDDYEFVGEIQGWVEACKNAGDAEVKIIDMVIYNWVYEFGSLACTSIIWQEGNGDGSSRVRLASNLDYNGMDTFVPLTVKAVFKYENEIKYEADMILGFYGFTRVYKKL